MPPLRSLQSQLVQGFVAKSVQRGLQVLQPDPAVAGHNVRPGTARDWLCGDSQHTGIVMQTLAWTCIITEGQQACRITAHHVSESWDPSESLLHRTERLALLVT